MSNRWITISIVLLAIAPVAGAHGQAIQFQQLGIDEGLSHNHVTAIAKDADGFLWFGTPSGLNRYDGHEVKLFRNEPNNAASLIDNGITELHLGPDARLWVRTHVGLTIYDAQRQSFMRNVDSVLTVLGLPVGDVTAIARGREGCFWFLLPGGLVYRYEGGISRQLTEAPTLTTGIATDREGNLWTVDRLGEVRVWDARTLAMKRSIAFAVGEAGGSDGYQLFIDRDGCPWLYSKSKPIGLFHWPRGASAPQRLATHSGALRLNNDIIFQVMQDGLGRIWVATDHGGVNLLDMREGRVDYLVNDEANDRSLRNNSVTALHCDADGIMWVGTFKGGVSYHHPQQIQFPVYRHRPGAKSSLPFGDVNRFVADRDGNAWIGTNGGGLLHFDRRNERFAQYRHDPADPGSLGSDVVVSLWLDNDGTLWVGTYHGGLNRFDGKRFVRYLHDPADASSVSDNSIWELFEDSRGRFWVGTLSGGLNLMDKRAGTFSRVGADGAGFPSSRYISAIAEDRAGAVWIGTATGVEVLHADGSYRAIKANDGAASGLSNDNVTDILEDRQRRLWFATHDGLNVYEPETDTWEVIKASDGLSDNLVLTILEDDEGTIWVSTAKGISAIRGGVDGSANWQIANYDRRDGLQATTFNENAAYRLPTGELLFGGPSGFNIIAPGHPHPVTALPRPVLTDFQLGGRSTEVERWLDGQVVALAHDQNAVGFVVASRYFLNKDRVHFTYQLAGFDGAWLPLDRQTRKAVFTNLDPGSYRFNVRVSADGETWSEPYTLASIAISPPFWKTAYAYVAYLVLFAGAILLVRHIERTRQQTRFALQRERQEARQVAELDRMKTRFFTNVSHEFRTPINLILAPIEKLQADEPDGSRRRHLDLIQRNARRLLNLVNQLLDFRKVDAHALRPDLAQGDIAAAIRQHLESFNDLAESGRIAYRFDIDQTHRHVRFDADKLERILFNLLSNAFKFTPAGGWVSVEVAFAQEAVTLVVQDNGIGIPPEERERVFERYFQHEAPAGILNQGSGIGLAITHEYVQLLGGTIAVESAVNRGTAVTVVLPLSPPGETATVAPPPPVPPKKGGKKRVLIVEDDDDFRFYLKDNLRESFAVFEAPDAQAGWALALSTHPDVIVSDVSMPLENGIAFCRRLKHDSRTRHIPVILLTAMVDDGMQLAGIEAGATDYLTKPFNFALLRTKLWSTLKHTDSMERTYKKRLDVRPAAAAVESADERFMRMLVGATERHMADTGFSVEVLAAEMNVSRAALYKRVLTLSGHTPSEFIRITRLRRAAKLLETSGMNVAEVAYEVGFGNPKQFRKYFKELYDVTPSSFRKDA